MEHRIIAMPDFLIPIGTQQKLRWVTEMQKALLNFRGGEPIVDQVESFGPEIQTIIWALLEVEHFPTPADSFQHGAEIDRIAWRSLDKVVPDPG